jgi:hypothetical protein
MTVPSAHIPPERIRRLNDRPERNGADFVLYWIQIYHRAEQNWALRVAVEAANRLSVPLVVYHGLGCTYPHANDRIHRFIFEGVAELKERFARRGISYHFYLRRQATDPNDLLYRLARRAARGRCAPRPLLAGRVRDRWCLGKHDCPWGERPVFGKVRYTSRAGMETKTDVPGYLDRVNRWCKEADRPDLVVRVPAKPAKATRKQERRNDHGPR